MAVVIILAGSLLGFVGGAAAFLFFEFSLLAAIAIWVGAGPVAALVAFAAALGTQPARKQSSTLPEGEVA